MSLDSKKEALRAVLTDVENEIKVLEAKDVAQLAAFHKAKEKFLLLDFVVHMTHSDYADLYVDELKKAKAEYDEVQDTPGPGREESRRLDFLRAYEKAIKSKLNA